jgi:hypothetical protein
MGREREREIEAKEKERGNGERKEGRRKVGGGALHDAEHGVFFSVRYHDTEPKCFARARASCHHAARAAARRPAEPHSALGGWQSPPKPSGDTVNDLRGRKWGCSSAPPGRIDFTTALALPGVAGELPGHFSGLSGIKCARK